MSDLKMWAVVELFGHDRVAGYVTEQEIAGEAFVRVDVPGNEETGEGFSKLYGPKAIYSITPVSETAALAAVRAFRPQPLGTYTWSVENELKNRLPAPVVDGDEDSEDGPLF
jgi:hypothetical protein